MGLSFCGREWSEAVAIASHPDRSLAINGAALIDPRSVDRSPQGDFSRVILQDWSFTPGEAGVKWLVKFQKLEIPDYSKLELTAKPEEPNG